MHVLFALGSGSAHFADDGDHFVQTGFLYYDDSGNCSELCIPDCPAGTSQTLSDSVGHRLFAANVGTMGLDCILRNMGKLIGISVLPETPRWFINITIMDFTNLRPILAAGQRTVPHTRLSASGILLFDDPVSEVLSMERLLCKLQREYQCQNRSIKSVIDARVTVCYNCEENLTERVILIPPAVRFIRTEAMVWRGISTIT